MLLSKTSVFIVLPTIQNQSKTKTIPHINFETSLTTILDKKLKRFNGGFFEMEMLEIFRRAFLLKIIIGT